jgi:hypothetical protein
VIPSDSERNAPVGPRIISRAVGQITGLDESTIAKWEREEHEPARRKWAAVREFFGFPRDDFC